MKDPYKILGVSRDATDDEIKKAYRNLAKKYHPDNYTNSPLSDLASEKMKEINEAYDEIQKIRSDKQYSSDNSGNTSGSSSHGYSDFSKVRILINEGHFSDAEIILDSYSQNDRNAEWNYLKGCVLIKRGWFFDAQKYLEIACYMDPGNSEYRRTLNMLKNNASRYGGSYRNENRSGECSTCDMCSSLICCDCLCECCGGDLIRCI